MHRPKPENLIPNSIHVMCNKCGYEWDTKSSARRIACSKCKTSIITAHRPLIGMLIKCKKCGYEWNYKGKAKRISCSKCKTSITIASQNPGPLPPLSPPLIKIKQFRLTRKTIKSHAWSKAYGWSNSNDEDIIFKANEDGVLSLV